MVAALYCGLAVTHTQCKGTHDFIPVAVLSGNIEAGNTLEQWPTVGAINEKFVLRVKKNQLDAQLILSIFRQPLHVSGVSRSIIRSYNRMCTTIGTYYPFQMTVCCHAGQHTVT